MTSPAALPGRHCHDVVFSSSNSHPVRVVSYLPALTLRGWRLLFLVALAVALFALLAPASTILDLKIWVASWLPHAAEFKDSDLLRDADKWVHLAIFLVLGGLGLQAWRRHSQRRQLLIGLLLMACGTELLQHYIPGRSASFADLGVDIVGLLPGMLVLLMQRRPLSLNEGRS